MNSLFIYCYPIVSAIITKWTDEPIFRTDANLKMMQKNDICKGAYGNKRDNILIWICRHMSKDNVDWKGACLKLQAGSNFASCLNIPMDDEWFAMNVQFKSSIDISESPLHLWYSLHIEALLQFTWSMLLLTQMHIQLQTLWNHLNFETFFDSNFGLFVSIELSLNTARC